MKILKKATAFLLILSVVLSVIGCGKKENEYTASLYFLNSAETKLEVEERVIPAFTSDASAANRLLKELISGPTRSDLKRSVPKDAAVRKIDVSDGVAVIDFNSAFTFENEVERVLACAAVVSTLTDLPDINAVRFLVDGKELLSADGIPVSAMKREDIVYDSQLVVSDYKFAKLYFSDKNAEKLVAETRSVTVNSKESLEYAILNELLKGPEEDGLYPTMPEGTKILSVETKEGTCFVNVSQEFKSKHTGGSASETMTIYSVVNTLTELDGIKKVQFLIEGQKVEVFIHYIFNEPFERDEKLIR